MHKWSEPTGFEGFADPAGTVLTETGSQRKARRLEIEHV
jgi:hypothetical protein